MRALVHKRRQAVACPLQELCAVCFSLRLCCAFDCGRMAGAFALHELSLDMHMGEWRCLARLACQASCAYPFGVPTQGVALAGAATSSVFVTVLCGCVSELAALAAPKRCCVALLAADSARFACLRTCNLGRACMSRIWRIAHRTFLTAPVRARHGVPCPCVYPCRPPMTLWASATCHESCVERRSASPRSRRQGRLSVASSAIAYAAATRSYKSAACVIVRCS